MADVKVPSSTIDREVVITRSLSAPRELVFKAWTDPVHLEHWYGPDGFITKTISMDFRVGGRWKFTMTGPDGTVFPNMVVYKAIIPAERLVHDHGDWNEEKLFEATITFEETDRGTRITMRSVFPSKEARDFVVEKYGAVEGGKQTLARLDAYLTEQRTIEP
ncbi:MAG: SRPBCC family protein [Flavobacteriales bacterium]|nr:SRPBCC family protein [Flavobacteriales bacterium]